MPPRSMVAPSPVVFRSVDRPELVLDEDDVALCDSCGDQSTTEYAAATREWGDCACCRGYRIVHGYTHGGRGLPVVMEAALTGDDK